MVVLRPDEELRELESLSLTIKSMFYERENVPVLNINQQNDKPKQEYQRTIWIRSHTTIAPIGKECYKGQQLQESQDIHTQMHRTKPYSS